MSDTCISICPSLIVNFDLGEAILLRDTEDRERKFECRNLSQNVIGRVAGTSLLVRAEGPTARAAPWDCVCCMGHAARHQGHVGACNSLVVCMCGGGVACCNVHASVCGLVRLQVGVCEIPCVFVTRSACDECVG